MNSRATRASWERYQALPAGVRAAADKAYRHWQQDHWHPSLHFKKIGPYWVARISQDYRALGIESDGTLVWFWIGPHKDYERLLG
jgi:hypothetical protein